MLENVVSLLRIVWLAFLKSYNNEHWVHVPPTQSACGRAVRRDRRSLNSGLVFMLEAVFMVDEGGRDCFFSGLCGLLKYNMEIEIEAK